MNAYAAFQTNQKIVALYQSGYLDQAKQSLDITTYVYQHGAGTLLDLLDAERTYRVDGARLPPGARGLHDQRQAAQLRGRKAGDSMRLAALVVALALTLAGCGEPPATARRRPARRRAAAGRRRDAGGRLLHRAGRSSCRICSWPPVAKSTWSTVLRTTGTVDWDNDHTTQAITQVSGPITSILVDTGTRVKTGDPLLYVSSADISNAISAYRKAKNRLDLAQRKLDRNKDLLDHKALSQRDFESAQADYNDAATDVQTSLQALKVFGVTATDITEAEQQNVGIRPSWRCARRSPGRSSRRWCCPGSSSRPGPPRRS